ncbi:MAG: universal stress protein [Bacteroidales bacterium]|nr:universal stress protein [Bacteroidales bacterium]
MENLLVTIVTFKKLHVACFVKEKFEFEGIECFLTDEGFKTTNSNIPQGIKLKVRANETEKAIRVLLQIHKEYDLDKIEQDSSVKDMKKILVPIDFSEYSINACKFAVGIAEKINAEINFLYVYNDPSETGSQRHTTSWEKHAKYVSEEAFSKAQNSLLEFGNNLKKQIPVENLLKAKIHYSLLKGRPENVIVNISEKYKPDVVIMGPKGKDEKKSVFIGSVTTKVIDNTRFPVLTIPKSATCQDIKKINIMYATNFNEADNSSLNKLLKIMSPFDKEIHCIHIDIHNDPYKQNKVDKLNQLLTKEYSEHKIVCKVFKSSNIIKGFDEFIEKNNIDIISFSKPKRSLFYKLFHPSNFEKLVSTEKIPMLIFPV